MHGRLKVKTTAEQQEAKRKEREKKLKLYTAATDRIFKKRKAQEFDDEALTLTGQVLAQNPDVQTLWNFRKEIFVNLKTAKSEEELQNFFQEELAFIESCLKGNPKSYGSWEHRCFCMREMPQPDWAKELQLCNRYLEYDERNFHCWDYRRFIVARSHVTPEDELQFTTDKISSNFSNYSSWYYRSKLLPVIHPDPSQTVGVSEQALHAELELAQNAYFTDPNDQSAWFYHRWLLGRGQLPLRMRHVFVSRQASTVFVTLTKAIKLGPETQLVLNVGGDDVLGEWRNQAGGTSGSKLWVFSSDDPAFLCTDKEQIIKVQIRSTILDTDESSECLLNPGETEKSFQASFKAGTLFSSELSAATSSTLKQELESIEQLHGLEPDNKWAMLTIILLMRALDPVKFENDALEYINKLICVDPCRKNYYNDLRSKILIEDLIQTNTSPTEFNLSDKGLTTLYHPEQLCLEKTIVMSGNLLTTTKGCEYFKCAKVLSLDGNSLESVGHLPSLLSLENLALQNNNIRDALALTCLRNLPQLKVLGIKGNPLCNEETNLKTVREMFPDCEII